MSYNQDTKGHGQAMANSSSPAPEYSSTPHPQSTMMDSYPGGSPQPIQSPPMAHQQYEQPTMYQQPKDMNYQQQPAMMQHDSNQQQIHQQQQMYGQPPPQQYQGGPMGHELPQRSTSGGVMAQDQGSQYRMATPIANLGMGAAPVDCPSCGKRGMTRISHHAGNTTHVWALVTFCFTLCLCFIPYLVNSLKDVQHNCSNCGLLLATWHKSGAVEVHAHV